mmetsp:Transcript_75147/g.232379  ORF Transcript_75147/g.232379 Transcript_75147/m.232379 type:complete len:317 (+) Transcript_75147:159-1109(+)
MPPRGRWRSSDHNARRLRAIAQGVCEESVEHVDGDLGLVHRDHVPSLVDLEEGEAAGAADAAGGAVVAHHGVGLVRRGVEVGLVGPLERQGPLLVPQPVADVVHVPGVDEHADAVRQHVGQERVVVVHPVLLELGVHQHVAGGPALGDAQLLLHLGGVQELRHVVEVVAELAVLARDAHVIGVPARQLVGDNLAEVADGVGRGAHVGRARVALADGGGARDGRGLHRAVGQRAVDDTVLQGATVGLAAIARHVGVPLVLLAGVREAVADAHALEVDGDALLLLLALPNPVRDGRNVVPCVALAEDEEGVLGKLGQL